MEEVKIPERVRIVGGTGEGLKKVYISKNVYQQIFSFSKDKNVCECGGVLLGNVLSDENGTCVIIHEFIEAKHSEGTSNSITFTKDTWNYIDQERQQYPEYDIVGWMHTNPDTGCNATEYDIFFQTHMLEGENIVAYIVDPVQIVEAFYFLEDGVMKKSDGFYIFMEPKEKKARFSSKRNKDGSSEKDHLQVETKSDIVSDVEIGTDGMKEAEKDLQSESYDSEDGVEPDFAKSLEEELNTVFEQSETELQENDDIDKGFNKKQRLSDSVDISDVEIPEQSLIGMKVLMSIVVVWMIALTIGIALLIVRVGQLEKDINQLYQNDKTITNYISGEDMVND